LCKEIIRIVNEHFGGTKSKIKHLPMRKGEPPRTHIEADLADLNQLMPGIKYTDLETGLIETIKYYSALPHDFVYRTLKYFEQNPLI